MARGLLERSGGQRGICVELALCYSVSVLVDALVDGTDYSEAISAEERCLQLLQGIETKQSDLPGHIEATDGNDHQSLPLHRKL